MEKSLRQRTKFTLSASDSSFSSLFIDDFLKKKSLSLFSTATLITIFLIYLSIFLVVFYCDVVRLPSPVSVEYLKTSKDLQFSEERARFFVTQLSEFGPKITGSYANEVQAVNYIRKHLLSIKKHATTANKIDIDVQKPSGCFSLAFMDGMTSCYSNIPNVVARIGPHQETNKSLLINCHFDTQMISPGASDNLVNCAIMLEVLISLSQSDQPLPNDVIFLFNGAEENFHQGAHGFITQHPWAKTIVGFIDMEACGAGGKQMLFQANREKTWLLQAYAKSASYPLGSVVAQDIFQNGVIPSDTDYRIFDQVGKLPGLDFSYIKNGYVYHSRYDIPKAITNGSIQQAGSNLLYLLHNALKSPDMTKVADQPNLPLIFFDFLGLFMVVYRISVARILNAFVILVSFMDFFWKNYKSNVPVKKRLHLIGKAVLTVLFSFILSYLVCISVVLLLGVFNASMSWYGSPYLIVGLYGCPTLAVIFSVHLKAALHVKNLREKWLQEDVYFDAARLIWILLLIIMELFKLNSSFICCAWLLFPCLVRGILGNLYDSSGLIRTKKFHLIMHISMQIIPLTLFLYCFWVIYSVFIPIMGRSGTVLNPELLIGLITAVFVFLATSYMVSLIHVMIPPFKAIMLLVIIFVSTFLTVCCTPLGFPYSDNSEAPTPMRLYILHTQRTFYKENGGINSKDSGYWLIPLDYNGPRLVKQFFQLDDIEPVDCNAELACGMPFYIPVQSLIKTTYYLPAAKPKIIDEPRFELVSKSNLGSNSVRLSFFANGSDHMIVIMSPRPGVVITNWSFLNLPPLRNLDWKGRPTYFIYYSYGQYLEPWTFSVDLLIDKQVATASDKLIDLNFITHYLSGETSVTGEFHYLLKQVPSYVDVVPWTATLDSFSF
ncbi:hypothetical protein JTE90_011597 [Oedothorax gibbosus]|uniref:FXNA-like protease n=1 Tax=Oedothorax gibbosus TaxID=931172 RepID=A0AAV6U616_9ARAC|nr:hypothetical protein JTE90_011597 [Oedothorax gibbosus]